MGRSNGGIYRPVKRRPGDNNHLKEDGILTKSQLTEDDPLGLGTFMDERSVHPKISEFLRNASHDWNKVK